MKTKIKALNECGIAHLALILGVVVLAVIIAAGFKVVQHNRGDKSSVSTRQNDTTANKEGDLANDALTGIALDDQTSQSSGQAATQQTASPNGTASSSKTNTATPAAKSSTIQGSQPSSGGTSGSSGSSSSSSNVETSDNGDTPQITLTYPSYWGQTVSGTITMTATASDSSGVDRVIFRIGRIGYAAAVYTETDTTAPYSATFDTTTLPNGGSDYTVSAQVFDNKGTGNSASHRINIQN